MSNKMKCNLVVFGAMMFECAWGAFIGYKIKEYLDDAEKLEINKLAYQKGWRDCVETHDNVDKLCGALADAVEAMDEG